MTVQTLTVTSERGAAVHTWTQLAQIWAAARDDRGREAVTAGAQTAFTERTYRIRWMAGLKAEQRVVDDGEVWEIVTIAELGRRDAMELGCNRVRA